MKKSKYRDYVKNVAIPVLVYGAVAGVFVGTLVYFFKLAADWLVEKSGEIYSFVSENPAFCAFVAGGTGSACGNRVVVAEMGSRNKRRRYSSQ